MDRGFLSQKGSRVGRGVKKKDLNRNKKSTSSGICVSTDSEDNINDDTPAGVASVIQEGVTSSLVDMTIEMGKQNSLDDTTVLESFPPLSTSVTTTTCNAHGKSLYSNITGKLSGKKVNVRTLFIPWGKKVAYPVVANYVRNTWGKYGLVRSMFSPPTYLFSFQFSFIDGLDATLENGPCEDGLSAIATKPGIPFMLDSYTSHMCLQSWGRSSYARVMIELRADVELKENIVVDMPKITKEGNYTCNFCVVYKWKHPRRSSCKVFRHIHEECPKNTGFKPYKEYRHVPKQSTAGSNGNKKKGEEPIIEVSNSNPFDVLNLVDNDVEKFKDLITSGQAIVVDKEGNPLKKVEFSGEDDGEDKVASVDNDMARSLAYERGFGFQSLLEQWMDSYGNGDYDDDPYDDDMYKRQDLSHELQAICNNLDIHVRGRNKK
uniref:DUF4283 domain-containing protein n=1 Tax=Tanacetum cinerariifolium TaxID=118510 RepID=A0A699GM95_TANCI|nr:hypothetical protein [Tanacetum cinerariifolium]